MNDETIFALSSGALPAAIAIVRVSGPHADTVATRLAGKLPEPRKASLRRLRSADRSTIDDALILRFPAPDTATGEDLVEFHLHGGRAVAARLLAELGAMTGLREAEPGEFTRRALMNGRLDLTQAEGLADLLAAETEWQRRAAVGRAGGVVSRQIEAWRSRLVTLSAKAEAAIDYVGDEDETAIDLASLVSDAEALGQEWEEWLSRPSIELIRDGLRVVLAGPPNSGKSSLFNALIGTDKAIVTPIAGTTRDVIEARVDLTGIPVTLMDTAGLRDSDDVVEQIGIERAERAQEDADLVLWLGDPDQAPAKGEAIILVHSRSDQRGPPPPGSIAASIRNRDGVELLRTEMIRVASTLLPLPDEATISRWQRLALRDALVALRDRHDGDVVLMAESARTALAAMDRLTGRQGTEDVLDALFGRFCLGK